MKNMSTSGPKKWEYFELKPLPENLTLIVGIPDVGLVGPIAVTYLIKNLKLELAGYVDSPLLPPVILFHDYQLLTPVRVYGPTDVGEKVAVFFSESAIPPSGLYSLAQFIVTWAASKRVKRLVMVGGVAVPNRMQIEKPKVYVATALEEDRELAKKSGLKLLREGFMGGAYAMLLKECFKRRFPGIALLAESHLHYPDPGAAAAVLEALEPLLGIKVDVAPLLEQEEEIRVKLRELMKRTVESMRGAGKEYEYTIPAMYV